MKTIAELDEIINELRLLIPNLKDLCGSWDDTSELYKEYISYLKVSGVTIPNLDLEDHLGKEENYIFWKLSSIYFPTSGNCMLQEATKKLLGER
ncbi:MAG: hypothetical protein GY814_10040 [Gammaproteobacteria bacterium]|nr:hypothetical protein [Gammaproteobacteria bacterium]